MSLKIGFANQYFTLWNVSSEDQFATSPNGQHYQTGTKFNFQYVQNLSMDESNAITKAESMGCSNLTPDPDLKGVTRSFSSFKEIKIEDPNQFRFGKYKSELISESTDFKYLEWYLNECQSDQLEIVGSTIGENIDGFVWKKGKLVDKANEKIQNRFNRLCSKIRKTGFLEFVVERNISVNGEDFFTMEIPGMGWIQIDEKQQPVSVLNYRGFHYGLPSGSRIKNKLCRVSFDYDSKRINPITGGQSTSDKFNITKIEKI